jgi:hypothetical protein
MTKYVTLSRDNWQDVSHINTLVKFLNERLVAVGKPDDAVPLVAAGDDIQSAEFWNNLRECLIKMDGDFSEERIFFSKGLALLIPVISSGDYISRAIDAWLNLLGDSSRAERLNRVNELWEKSLTTEEFDPVCGFFIRQSGSILTPQISGEYGFIRLRISSYIEVNGTKFDDLSYLLSYVKSNVLAECDLITSRTYGENLIFGRYHGGSSLPWIQWFVQQTGAHANGARLVFFPEFEYTHGYNKYVDGWTKIY